MKHDYLCSDSCKQEFEIKQKDKQLADLQAQLDAANAKLDRDRLIRVINDTVDKQQCLGAVDIADAILTIEEG